MFHIRFEVFIYVLWRGVDQSAFSRPVVGDEFLYAWLYFHPYATEALYQSACKWMYPR
jgi:hypothetical protein